jgi:hypothetical protein
MQTEYTIPMTLKNRSDRHRMLTAQEMPFLCLTGLWARQDVRWGRGDGKIDEGAIYADDG